MDLSKITDVNQVRAVIMPVGAISANRFRYFSQLISSFHTLQLSHLTRNVTDKSRVLRQDWANGVFRFLFTELKDWYKSEWEELHCMRKAFAIIGIIDGAVTSDWAAAYKTMVDGLKRFTSHLSHICFIFEPGEKPDVDRNPHLIVIPNAEESRLQFYLQTLLLDLASRLLRTMEDWVFDATEAQATLTTSLDYNQGPDDVPKLKKRKAARLQKNKGDYCLLVGAPADAITFYTEALSLTRANGDTLWYAACLESLAAATLISALQEVEGHQLNLLAPDLIEENIEAIAEAIQSYGKRKAPALEVELWVRLGKLYASLARKADANEAWMSAQVAAAPLTKQLKIQLSTELTALFHEIGMRRKAAFFLREAALLHAKIFNHALSHRLLSLAAPSFLLYSDASPQQALSSIAQREKVARVKRDSVPVGWAVLQKYVLKDLIAASKNASDPNTTAGYITFLLRNYKELLSNKYQVKLASALSVVTDDLPVSMQMTMHGLPQLVSITLEPLPPALSAYPARSTQVEKSIFITSPFERRKEKKELLWVENEVAEVQVILSNPMAFPITIESISLSTAGVPFEAYSVSLVLPPATPKTSVLLSGKPLESGVLFVKGVMIRAFNLLCEHHIGANGKAISLTDASKLSLVVGQTHSVRVIPSLPRLLVRDQSAAAGNISLFIGQEAAAEFELENIGGQSITFMELTVQANYQHSLRDPPPSTFVWDDAKIRSSLPLLPGAKFTFTGSFTAKALTIGHTLTINYGNEKQENFRRRVEVSCPVNLLQGLGVGRIDTIEWAGTAIPFADIPAVPPPCVLLSFEVVNSGPTVFQLECQVSDDAGPFFNSRAITIEPHSSKRVLLPMRKFHLPPVEEALRLPPNKHPKNQVSDVDRYLAELSKRVLMRWRALTSNSDGVLSFLTSSVFFPESCITLLSAPPVNIRLCLPGKGDDVTMTYTTLFDFSEIEIVVYNSSSQTRNLTLSLLCYQDFNNGIIDSNLRGKLAISGSPQVLLSKIAPGASVVHLMVVAFLAAGRYKFSASCRDDDGVLYATPTPLCIAAGLT